MFDVIHFVTLGVLLYVNISTLEAPKTSYSVFKNLLYQFQICNIHI